MVPVQSTFFCQYCNHPSHEVGKQCGVLKENGKPCKCKGKGSWLRQIGAGFGNAIGESLFGGNR